MNLSDGDVQQVGSLLPQISVVGLFHLPECRSVWVHCYSDGVSIDMQRCTRLSKGFALMAMLRKEEEEPLEVLDQQGRSFYLLLQHPRDALKFHLFCWEHFDHALPFSAVVARAYISRDLLLRIEA